MPETTIDLIVNKTWEDNKIQAQRRPETLTFQLIANKKRSERCCANSQS